MTNPNDTLNTLWEMSERGTKEWWPDAVHRTSSLIWTWIYDEYGDTPADLVPQHALDLVAASCERWLVGKGWISVNNSLGCEYMNPKVLSGKFISLTEAIEYAQQQ